MMTVMIALMGQASSGRAIVKIIAVAASVVLLSASANAGLRLGPGAVLGLAAIPLHMMTHGMGLPELHRRAAHAHGAAARAVPSPAPTARPVPNPPTEPPVVEARADPSHVVEPSRPASAAASPASSPSAPPLAAPWPLASPSVYEDLLGYVLWPGDYANRLWTHGYGDIMNTLLAPMTAAANADQVASMIQNGMCSTKASDLADRLIARTSEIIVPTSAQQAALDELASALGEAIDRGRAAVCAGAGDPLKRMVDGLWIMWDATLLLRAPLEKFYDALTPAQKEKLMGGAAAGQALARACADQHAADWSGERLAQALGAGEQQRLTLEALRERSSELIKFLAISCPQEIKPTPMDRLAAAGDRMNALLYVVMSMSPAMNELYGSLKDEPKAPPASNR
jgi:hypothetical protein